VKTFPIKKRINIELYIDGKEKLYKHKSKEPDKENIGPVRRG